jgi:plasmid stabilization system protein ParE
MRVVYAESFVDDADVIAQYIEGKFGAARADVFINDLNRFCENVASQPRVGRQNHGYDTTLFGVILNVNWIFFEHDSDEVRFVHIVDGRRRKSGVAF